MSSTGANRETEGGTMKNVIDNPQTEPQCHKVETINPALMERILKQVKATGITPVRTDLNIGSFLYNLHILSTYIL